jgi:hypothetical protein
MDFFYNNDIKYKEKHNKIKISKTNNKKLTLGCKSLGAR